MNYLHPSSTSNTAKGKGSCNCGQHNLMDAVLTLGCKDAVGEGPSSLGRKSLTYIS